MKHCLVLLLFALAAAIAPARVGDTEADLIKRFGPPKSRTSDLFHAESRSIEIGTQLTFRQEDWTITCHLIDGRSARASYSKVGNWTEDHFLTVLTANAQGERWQETTLPENKELQRQWRRADGALATWAPLAGMTIVTPAYERAKTVAEAKLKAQSRKVPKL